jgi:MFS family permease
MTLSPFVSNPPPPTDNYRTSNDHATTATTNEYPTSPSDQQQPQSPPAQHFSLLRLLCMFAVSFSYGLVFNTVNNIVIPNEIERLTTSRQSMWVGLIMASGAISQFATPVAGAWSDRSGDRVKFLLAGSLVTVCGVVGFSVVSSSCGCRIASPHQNNWCHSNTTATIGNICTVTLSSSPNLLRVVVGAAPENRCGWWLGWQRRR